MEDEVPKEAAFTLIIPLDREKTKTAKYHLKEIDEAVFLAGKAMIAQGKNFDAVRMIIKSLSLPGSDSVELLKSNFIAVHAATGLILEIIEPLEGELKKN